MAGGGQAVAPPPAGESPQELKKLVERTKSAEVEVKPQAAPKEEVARLRKLGLEEKPVRGTTLMLVGLIDESKAPVGNEQRVEIARRLNEVGSKLPRYVMHLVNEKRPVQSAKAVVQVAQHVASGDELRRTAKAEKDKHEKKGGRPAKPERKPKEAAKKEGAAKGGIGGLICKLLLEKKGTDEVLAAVMKQFPSAKTSAASVAWYRSQLRGEGKLPKS